MAKSITQAASRPMCLTLNKGVVKPQWANESTPDDEVFQPNEGKLLVQAAIASGHPLDRWSFWFTTLDTQDNITPAQAASALEQCENNVLLRVAFVTKAGGGSFASPKVWIMEPRKQTELGVTRAPGIKRPVDAATAFLQSQSKPQGLKRSGK